MAQQLCPLQLSLRAEKQAINDTGCRRCPDHLNDNLRAGPMVSPRCWKSQVAGCSAGPEDDDAVRARIEQKTAGVTRILRVGQLTTAVFARGRLTRQVSWRAPARTISLIRRSGRCRSCAPTRWTHPAAEAAAGHPWMCLPDRPYHCAASGLGAVRSLHQVICQKVSSPIHLLGCCRNRYMTVF